MFVCMKVIDIDGQNSIIHPLEEGTRQWFYIEIPNHFVCWHILDINLLSLGKVVGDEEIWDVYMIGPFCAGCLAVLFKQDVRLSDFV